MNVWKIKDVDLFGVTYRYRFPLTAWILGEARYYLIFKPKIRLAYWWRLISKI